MRGSLSEEKLEEITSRLPGIDRRLLVATFQGPDVDLHDLTKGDKLGIALVCLEDAAHRFSEVGLALHEAYACQVWYLEASPKAPLEFEAAFACRFYADYVPLLLYAAGEDIAAFIVHFLGVGEDLNEYLENPETVRKLEEKSVSSNAAKVGIYLGDEYADHGITKIVLTLHKSRHWRDAMSYRNTWVHEKPPIIDKLGIQYDRKSRVRKTQEGGASISFGGGSEPKYTVEELLEMAHGSASAFAEALSALLEMVIKRREEIGEIFKFDSGGGGISFGQPKKPTA